MKKIFFILIMACIFCCSCKKEGSKGSQPKTQLQPITFKVGFSEHLANFQNAHLIVNSTSTDTALTNYINVMYYMVFDSIGNSVHNITQLSTDPNFGSYTDNLHPGKYTVAIAAGKTGLGIVAGASLSKQYIAYSNNVTNHFTQDAFFQKISLTVSNTPSSQNISLNRITSKLIVNINDAIPNGASRLLLSINGDVDAFFVGSASPGYSPNGSGLDNPLIRLVLPPADAGKTNYQLSTLFLGNSNSSLNVNIECDGTGQQGQLMVYSIKPVSSVAFQPNKITILSGNLFGGSGSGNVQVSADTTWSNHVTIGF